MKATNQQMTSERLDELMVVAVSMQRDAEKLDERPVAVFAYAVQLALTELQNTRQQLAVVVAESAGAKKVISECREYFIAGVMNRIRPTNEGYLHMICDTFADETPATDAYLAEAEARGVDKFATELGHVYQQLRPGSNHAHAIKSVVFRAAEFAAQLRQGAA